MNTLLEILLALLLLVAIIMFVGIAASIWKDVKNN